MNNNITASIPETLKNSYYYKLFQASSTEVEMMKLVEMILDLHNVLIALEKGFLNTIETFLRSLQIF